jgi:hypothetical protein
MTDSEFAEWLEAEVADNRMTTGQQQDLLDQKRIFENQRSIIEEQYRYQIVGIVAGQLRVGREVHALLGESKMQFPGRMIYFEPIGFHLF